MVIKDRVVIWIATGGGIGYIPVAPGTFGSLLGVLLFVGLSFLPPLGYGVVLVALAGLGVWASTEAEHLLGRKDASVIVIDEIVGVLIALWGLSVRLYLPIAIAFGLFRLFDIIKPWPALERLPRGWGVMMDDVFAGLLALGILRILMGLI